jgi:uncharacterized protein YjiS (DUF1127 family)
MTTTTSTRHLPVPSPIFSLFSRMVSLLERHKEQARIHDELSHMSSRDLADLGLMHSDIADVAKGTYRRG